MVATIAAGTSAGYYLAQSEYYLGGSEPPGEWIAGDPGFGIANGARVEAELFEHLHAAIGPDGVSLLNSGGGRIDRVPGYDMTFSAPKSVSVLWALCDEALRQGIEVAQAGAVRAAIQLLECNAGFSRRGRNGLQSEAVDLNVAAFQHGEARPTEHGDGRVFADPQLHTHAVILNLARRADGTVGTLDGRRLFAWKMAAGATYHLALASGLQRIGLSVTDIGKNGMFEIADVDAGLAEYFSARRAEIEETLEEAGLTSAAAPALAGAITKASRKTKAAANHTDRFKMWKEMAAALGYEPQCVVEGARTAGAPVTASEHDVRTRLQIIPEQLTQTESVFERRQLVASVATALVGSGASADRIEQEVQTLIEAGGVVELGADAIGEMRYSTPEMIRLEREILAMARKLSARSLHAPDRTLADRLVVEGGLSGEQADAISAATAANAIAVIEGAAGSGKTTSLRPIVEAHRAAGYTVLGSATAWRIAHQLRDDLGIEARATDSWLAVKSAGQSFLDDRTLLVVDEAGQLSSRQMHAVLTEVERAGAKLVLVGDRRQLQPIGAGGALSIVARAAEIARVDQVVRQREEWARQATMALAAGKTSDALQAYADHSHVHLHAGAKAAVKAMADAWETATSTSGEETILLLARTNGQVREINGEIRNRMRTGGMLRGPDIGIDVITGSGQSYELALAVGDAIRFLVRHDGLGVVNGTIGTVTAISGRDTANPEITARLQNAEVTFVPADLADENGKARLGHAYASTIYGAQGLTADRSLVLLDPACDRHDTYVGLSRARDRTEIFTDRRIIDAGIRAEQPLSRRNTMAETDDSARIAWLGERLARSAIKGTTLDLMSSLGPVQESSKRLVAARSHAIERE
jgi:conjugative relaxase-like TrwC/TraI family protein